MRPLLEPSKQTVAAVVDSTIEKVGPALRAGLGLRAVRALNPGRLRKAAPTTQPAAPRCAGSDDVTRTALALVTSVGGFAGVAWLTRDAAAWVAMWCLAAV